MKIFIRDLRLTAVPNSQEMYVRFSVTFARADGRPVCTVKGWRVDRGWKVQGPASRIWGGRFYHITENDEEFLAGLLKTLEGMKDVRKALGPRVGEELLQSAVMLEGEGEVEF